MDKQVPLAQYTGETSRTPYSRGHKHLSLYTGSETEKSKSFMWRHCEAVHGGVFGSQNGVGDFRMDLIAPYKDPLARVLWEALEIQKMENKELGWRSVEHDGRKTKCLNSKQEYYQNVIPRSVQISGNIHEI